MKLRLAHVIDTLPKYKNNFNSGLYKNGTYKNVSILIYGTNNSIQKFDANNFPRELLEAPWYIKEIYPVVTSTYGRHANSGLYIVIEKEVRDYE